MEPKKSLFMTFLCIVGGFVIGSIGLQTFDTITLCIVWGILCYIFSNRIYDFFFTKTVINLTQKEEIKKKKNRKRGSSPYRPFYSKTIKIKK